ncbi:MarR family transcriptional regulator [uncultured Albimonas sp.]|uniref:MarR family winged helix-turn-helix transcriptional regulator n=1 Tax=uncultured Albimonas sp. TaxID=1331701 RepID=UPI0030EBCBB6
MSAAISQVYADAHGLSRDEWRVLAATGEAEAQPTRAIAEQTGLDKVAISRAASSLEDRGLIRRTEDRADRRIKILRLTPAGADALEEIERQVRDRETYLLQALSAEERATLEGAIEKLCRQAEALILEREEAAEESAPFPAHRFELLTRRRGPLAHAAE